MTGMRTSGWLWFTRSSSACIAILLLSPLAAGADPVPYLDRIAFEAVLGMKIVDDYSSAGYRSGDLGDPTDPDQDVHSDAHMSSVLGETAYVTTGFSNLNIVFNQLADPKYCAGCNGSFELDFQDTSVGDARGVFGVGFDFFNTYDGFLYSAFVTFGDGSTAAFPLAQETFWPDRTSMRFFAITAAERIQSIHFATADGASSTSGSFGIDNLTIGSPAPVPEPATLLMLGSGLAALGVRRRMRQRT